MLQRQNLCMYDVRVNSRRVHIFNAATLFYPSMEVIKGSKTEQTHSPCPTIEKTLEHCVKFMFVLITTESKKMAAMSRKS